MSGIIGGAGSKSGVIGTTELEYEEGTWTPKQDVSGTAFGSATAYYTKIGSNVNVWFDVSTWDSNDPLIYNLPFAATTAAPAGSCDINFNTVDADMMGRIDGADTKIRLSIGTSAPVVGSSTRIIGHAQYCN